MRLIDGDALMKKVRCRNNTNCAECDFFSSGDTWCDGETFGAVIMQMPLVNAVPVVRCKDCDYVYDDISGLCCSHGVCVDCTVPPDFFCAEGKGKENET